MIRLDICSVLVTWRCVWFNPTVTGKEVPADDSKGTTVGAVLVTVVFTTSFATGTRAGRLGFFLFRESFLVLRRLAESCRYLLPEFSFLRLLSLCLRFLCDRRLPLRTATVMSPLLRGGALWGALVVCVVLVDVDVELVSCFEDFSEVVVGRGLTF